MAVPTDTAEAGAFGTAGAGFESRTRLRNVPGSVASEDEPALVDPGGNAPHRSACKAKQRPFASEPKRFAGCWRIERHPADLESAWPPWPAPHSASYEDLSELLTFTRKATALCGPIVASAQTRKAPI